MSVQIGIDFGTDTVLLYVKGKGVVLKEPSLIAVDLNSKAIKAIGEEARQKLKGSVADLLAVRPVRKGSIASAATAERMLRYFLFKSYGERRFIRPSLGICVSCEATDAEKKFLIDAAFSAGAKSVSLVEKPIASAIGSGIDIFKSCGNMIADIGGGTSDIAVISSGKTIVNTLFAIGGNDFDSAIVRYMKKTRRLLIGRRAAEDLKIKIGTVNPLANESFRGQTGRDLATGLQKSIRVTSSEMAKALIDIAEEIAEAIALTLKKSPPSLSRDIAERGIVLAGGGSLLRGFERLVEEKTGIHTVTADEPMNAAAVGSGLYASLTAL